MSFYSRLVATLGLPAAGLLAHTQCGRSDDEIWGLSAQPEAHAVYSEPAALDQAVAFFEAALLAGRRPVVYGDYDVDGLTSVSIVFLTLRLLGLEKESGFYIPSRYDTGYGLNTRVLAQMAAKGYGLVVATDNGITKKAECDFLSRRKIQYVILDHHEEQRGQLPGLGAGIGAMYHRNDCSAAFLALLFARRVLADRTFLAAWAGTGHRIAAPAVIAAQLEYFVTLAGLAVFSDCMPLSNPFDLALAKRGLAHLNAGLKAPAGPSYAYFRRLTCLLDDCGDSRELTYGDINFAINSRLNAVARVWGGNRTNLGAWFLTAPTYDKAAELAVTIKKANEEKKKLVRDALAHCDLETPKTLAVLDFQGRPVPSGLSGLVANAVLDTLNAAVPVLVLCDSKIAKDELIGSLRGPEGLALDKVLESPYVKPFLKDHGGHEAACGFTLPAALKPVFVAALTAEVSRKAGPGRSPSEMAIEEAWVGPAALRVLADLEPFGIGFECPKMVLRLPRERLLANAHGDHLLVPLEGGGRAVLFNARPIVARLVGAEVDCVGTLRAHAFKGAVGYELVARPRPALV